MKISTSYIKIQRNYLLLLWAMGIGFFIYLCLPFLQKKSGMYLSDIFSVEKNNTANIFINKKAEDRITGNEALLFVTINKKKFLTKFVTYVSDEELVQIKLTDTVTHKEEKSFMTRGRTRIKKQAKDKEDFIIKSAPKI